MSRSESGSPRVLLKWLGSAEGFDKRTFLKDSIYKATFLKQVEIEITDEFDVTTVQKFDVYDTNEEHRGKIIEICDDVGNLDHCETYYIPGWQIRTPVDCETGDTPGAGGTLDFSNAANSALIIPLF